jgi:hypothetical protein
MYVGISSIKFYLLQRMSVRLSSSLLLVFVIIVVIVLAVTGEEGVEDVTEAVSISDAGEIQEDRFMQSKEFRVSWDLIIQYYVLFVAGNHGWCGRVLGRGVQHGVHLPHDGGGQRVFNQGEEEKGED